MNRYLVSACVAFAGVLGGCTMKPAHMVQEQDPYLSQGRIQFESSRIKYVLQVARVDTARVGSGLLKVTVTFRNTTKENVWIEVRTTFLDADKHVSEQTNWEPVLLDARTVTEYGCTSLNSRAADYQIIIRRPKKPATSG